MRGQEIEERIVRRRGRFMDRPHDGVKILRAGDPAKFWKFFQDRVRLRAHAAGDDDLAVFGERLADRIERLRLRAVEEAAGVDDDEIGALVLARQRIALGAEPGDDALGIDQRLRAAERNEAHRGCGGLGGVFGSH